MNGGSDGQTGSHSFKLSPDCRHEADRRPHKPETTHEQCGTSALKLMLRRRALQWMRHTLQMDEDRLPRQAF
eukprot:351479-Chlamydomonas_euryale.AAC.30